MAPRKTVKAKEQRVAKRARPPKRAGSAKLKDAKVREVIKRTVDRGILKTIRDDPSLARPYAKRLDFSPASLRTLDRMIQRLWEGTRPSDQHFGTMVWALGAYVATVIQRNHDGVWVKSKNRYDFHCAKNGKPTGFVVNPWSWVYKRFDEDDMLALKYKIVMKMADNFA